MSSSPRSTPIPVGQKFGKRTVLAEAPGPANNPTTHVTCRCDCGSVDVVALTKLVRGKAQYCVQCRHSTHRTHGQCHTGVYRSWYGLLQRCQNPKCKSYPRYGGRGITVCERWRSFENFFSDMGHRPTPKHTIERLDNNKGYSPENCAWRTMKEQNNNRRSNFWITFNDRTQTLTAWGVETGINYVTLHNRLKSGWSVEKSLTTPVLRKG